MDNSPPDNPFNTTWQAQDHAQRIYDYGQQHPDYLFGPADYPGQPIDPQQPTAPRPMRDFWGNPVREPPQLTLPQAPFGPPQNFGVQRPNDP